MMKPKIFIGPMSRNIVDASIEWCNETSNPLGLIPSRRQVEYNGGYVNSWTTKDFSKYIKSKTNKILLVRDHGGPNQGDSPDDGLNSLKEDQNSEYVNIDKIRDELNSSRKLFKENNWPTIDVTRKSVEETAASVIKIYEIYKQNV